MDAQLRRELLQADANAAWRKYEDACRMVATDEERKSLYKKWSALVKQQVMEEDTKKYRTPDKPNPV